MRAGDAERGGWREWLRERGPRTALLALVFVGLTAVMFRPDPTHLFDRIPSDTGDPALEIWTLSWVTHAIHTAPLHIFDANRFWPQHDALAYSEMMLPLALLFGPLRWLSGNWSFALTMTQLGLVVFTLATTYALAHWLTGRRDAAVVGAAAFSFSAFVLSQIAHLQMYALGFVALSFLVLFRLLETPRLRLSIALGVVLALTVLASVYYGMEMVVAAIVVVAAFGAWRRRRVPLAVLPLLALAAVVAATLAAPAALSYVRVEHDTGFHREFEPDFALRSQDFLTAARGSYLHKGLAAKQPINNQEHRYFPGFTVLALAAVGGVAMRGARRPGLLVLLVLAGVALLSLAYGPNLFGHQGPFRFFHDHVPGFRGIRVTARFASVALLALAMLAANGYAALAAHVPRRAVPILFAASLGLLLAELAAPLPWAQLDDGTSTLAVYHALATRPPGAVVELPIMDARTQPGPWAYIEGPRMVYSTIDWNPRFNGYSGFVPLNYFDQLTTLNTFPSPESLAVARHLHLRYIVIGTGAPGGLLWTDDQARAAATTGLASRYGNTWLIDLGRR